MNITKHASILITVFLLIMATSAVILVVNGLNMGIDFTGGTILEREFPYGITGQELREVLSSSELADLNLDNSVIQPIESGRTDKSIFLIRTGELTNDQIDQIDSQLIQEFTEVQNRRTELVGPVIGKDLIKNSILALLVSAIGILIYVSLRFEYRFGLASLVLIVHDVLLMLAVVSLLKSEINTPFVAAILTIVGYSINNTIVVFDRVRENLALQKKESLSELVNRSIIQTLPRCINTSVTTLLAVGALYFLGGSSLKDFNLSLIVGLVAGFFSSAFFAGPFWLLLKGTLRKPVNSAAETSK
jgi:preprotein translocase subunit SecF